MRKVGEKVQIRPKKWYDVCKNKFQARVYNPEKYKSGLPFTREMSDYCGREMTIKRAFKNDKGECIYILEGSIHYWAEYMFDDKK